MCVASVLPENHNLHVLSCWSSKESYVIRRTSSNHFSVPHVMANFNCIILFCHRHDDGVFPWRQREEGGGENVLWLSSAIDTLSLSSYTLTPLLLPLPSDGRSSKKVTVKWLWYRSTSQTCTLTQKKLPARYSALPLILIQISLNIPADVSIFSHIVRLATFQTTIDSSLYVFNSIVSERRRLNDEVLMRNNLYFCYAVAGNFIHYFLSSLIDAHNSNF